MKTKFFYSFFLILIIACQNAPTTTENNQPPTAKGAAVSPPTTPIPEERSIKLPPGYDKTYLLGRFDPAKHLDFAAVDPAYASGSGYYLHKDTYAAFQKMHAAAKADGVNLKIISATRNFEAQKSIWDAKWTGNRKSNGIFVNTIEDPKERALEILKVSSMPGSSRHHWGTDMDLNNLTNDYFSTNSGKKIYDWLTTHAATYGFCQPYSAGRDRGYMEEKWHWSYQPLAVQLLNLATQQLKNEDFQGFLGAETAMEIDVVKNYVLGINPACLPGEK